MYKQIVMSSIMMFGSLGVYTSNFEIQEKSLLITLDNEMEFKPIQSWKSGSSTTNMYGVYADNNGKFHNGDKKTHF